MRVVVVERFGPPEVMTLREMPDPQPRGGEVRVRLTSIGVNHADLMARRGEYRLYSGEPPFVPGLEGGGIIDAVGEGVPPERLGQRVVLSAEAPRRPGAPNPVEGTYRTHYVVPAQQTLPAPDNLPDDALGTVWLSHLTAWGCLVWKQGIKEGDVVAIPAATSSVGLAAAQVARARGAVAIGLTRTERKAEELKALQPLEFDHVVVTHNPDGSMRPWARELKRLTDGRGVDVFFDPVANGPYLDSEIQALAQRGTIWIYGLLGKPGVVDLTPLIRKQASIRGWVLGELLTADPAERLEMQREVLRQFEAGVYRQRIAARFPLEEVRQAHETMERAEHIGKIVLIP